MKLSYLKALVIAMLGILYLPSNVQATHVVGGNLTYKHVSGDIYEISLTFRRDCFNGADDAAFDNPARVWIFNGNGNLQSQLGVNGRLKMNFNPDDTLNNIVVSDCGFEGAQVCVHETTYKEEVRLPFNPGENGYILSYQRCCRNETLANIDAPLLTGGTWVVEITPEAQIQGNDSPTFVQWPDVYICANEDLVFDHSAIDSDGDSLVYRLCTPYSGATEEDPIPDSAPFPPYDNVEWGENYGLDNLLGGVPLQIDPNTGLLTGNPNLIGQFLVGICVEEYRNGVKIGEVRRDFQYNVRICSDPPTAIFEANDGNCNGTEVQFENQSLGGTSFQWNFNFPSTDAQFLSTEENPLFVYDEEGVYDVQLIVTRGTDTCSDTIVQPVPAIFSNINVEYELEIQACNDDGGYSIRLIDRSTESQEGFDIIGTSWELTQGGNTQTFVGPIVNTDILNEDFIIYLQVESETSCKQDLSDTISIADFEHVADFAFELAGCSDANTANLAAGDVSDPLNPFDSPQGYEWTVVTTLGTEMYSDSSILVDIPVGDIATITLTTDFGGGCFATVTKEIAIDDLIPQASYSLDATGCPDDGTVDVIYTNTSADSNPDYSVVSTSWSASVAGENFTSDELSLTINIPKDSVVTFTMVTEFDNGCIDTISESFVPGPFATISFDADPFRVCIGDSVAFVSNPNSDFTYTWSPMEGLYFEDQNDLSNPFVIGIEDTEYFVTVSDGLCEISSSVSIVALDTNNLGIEGDSITCDGNVSLTASGGIGDGDFVWSLTSDFADTIFVGNVLETSFEGQEQTYYVSFTGESCGDPFAEFTVKLSDIFDVVFNGDPVRVCIGDTVPLLNNPDPLLTYVWSPLDGLYFTDPNDGSTAHVIGIQDTEYEVTISDDFCSLDTMIAVAIADGQDFTVLGDSIVCDENVQLVGFGATGIGEYQWSLDPDFNTIIHEGDTLVTTLDGLNETYYVQFTDKTCGDLILSYFVRQFVFDLTYIESYMICPGDTIDYTIFNEGEGPLTFEWVDDVHILSGGDSNTPVIGVDTSETEGFDLVFTATSPTGCTFTDTIVFEIDENPVVDFTYTLTDCGEYIVCFEIEGDYNGFPSWTFGDPTTEDDVSIDAAPCYTYPYGGVFEVVLSNISPICPYEDVVHLVTVNDDISLDPIDDVVLCIGDTVSLEATSPNFNVDYYWCNLDGDTIQTGPLFTSIVDSIADKVIVKVEDVNGCSDLDTVMISPFIFNITDNVSDIFCDSENTDIEIFVNGDQDGYTFEWGPDECVISGGNTANPILIADDSKTFFVNIIYDSLGCEFQETYDISTTSYTIDVVAEPDTVINQGDEVTLYVEDAFEDYTYEWSNGSFDEEITVQPEMSTWYYVTVTDGRGCTAEDSLFIRVRIPECDETDVFLPNAFTPNGDNVNDILFLRSNFIDEMELLIYNRWGEEVFRSTDINVGWDGTYNGEQLAPDVYAYTLRVICINQLDYSTRGNVSILK